MNIPQFSFIVALSVALLVTPSQAAERTPDVWARSIHHGDGSRTDSMRDANAQVIESKTFDKSGKMVMKRVLQADTKGIPQQGYIYDESEKPVYKLSFDYDEIGRLSKSSLFTPSGEPITRVEHRYDSEGNEIAPNVKHFAGQPATQPGQILPSAAMAAPGSNEPVLAGSAAPEKEAAKPAEKKRGFFKFFKKNK